MKVGELFKLKYGTSLELLNCEQTTWDDPEGVAFVSRSAENNGVSAYVKPVEDTVPQGAGLLTCALGGSVLSSFVQPRPFYTAFHVMVLEPMKELSLTEKLFYCMCIQANAYRYSYGRQANRTLKDIELPDRIPDYVYQISCQPITTKVKGDAVPELNMGSWQKFRLGDIFSLKKGKRLTKEDMLPGTTRFIGAIDDNNGVRDRVDAPPTHEGNCITVNYNGSVGEAFYQPDPFWASDDVNVLSPKGWIMNSYNALFICTVIKRDRYRFGYGRKWTLDKMSETVIPLPSRNDGEPDFRFMESYIKSLPYGDRV